MQLRPPLLQSDPLYLLFFNVYLESGRLFLQRERELEESRANAMMLKFSPHFIANTLSSIVALCYTDAPKAGELASNFAVYLRDNYADMSERTMIPFSKELEPIGIANAKARLYMLCGGTLAVTSQRGEGTVCEIRIPKEASRK